MKFVEDYYTTYQYQNPELTFKKRVYIATDEPKVFSEARSKYVQLPSDETIVNCSLHTDIPLTYSTVTQPSRNLLN